MVALSSFLCTVIFVMILFSSNFAVHGFSESSCPENATVALTGNTSKEFPMDQTWSKDGIRIGCLCDVKTCVTLCCPQGNAMQVDVWRCVNDNVTFGTFPFPESGNFTVKDLHPIIDDPCRFNWMAPSILTKYEVFPNSSLSGFEQHCLFRTSGSKTISAKVCWAWVRRDYGNIFAVGVAFLIMLVIFIGYTIIPELRNMHGLIFRCYVGTYIVMYVCALAAQFATQMRTVADVYTLFDTLTRYCAGCCGLWLNVMSFNIWRSFRWLRPINRNANQFERRMFIIYAIYAWIIPAVAIGGCTIVLYTVPQFRNDVLRHDFKSWGSAAVIAIIFICNGLLFVSTALKIRGHKKDTTQLIDCVNKHHEIDSQWFNLYLKLSFIMGGHLIIWSIWYAWPTPETTHLITGVEVLQGISVFLIFLWKDNFKRLVCERISFTLSKIAYLSRRSNLPETSEPERMIG